MKALVLKTSDAERHRGFESLSLRQNFTYTVHVEKYPSGRRGSPAKGVGCDKCRPGSNPGFSAIIPTFVGIKRLTDCGESFAMPTNMQEIAAYLSPFCRNTRSDLKAASLIRIRLVFRQKMMHTPLHAVIFSLWNAHGVCIPLHGCSDHYFLSIPENKAQISFSRYAHLLHRAVPQRFIKA